MHAKKQNDERNLNCSQRNKWKMIINITVIMYKNIKKTLN